MKACIIGSFQKYYDDICMVIDCFNEAGITTLSPKYSSIKRNEEGFVILKSDYPNLLHEQIQLMVFHRMFQSDFIYVWNPDGYIGKTTSYEIGRAVQKGIPIYYKEPPEDLPLCIPDNAIISPQELCNYINKNNKLPKCLYKEGSLTLKLIEALENGIYFSEFEEVLK